LTHFRYRADSRFLSEPAVAPFRYWSDPLYDAAPLNGAGMRRREFLGILAGTATWPWATRAQTSGRSYRIGYLTGLSRQLQPNFLALLDELRLGGFIEGQNLSVLDDAVGVGENELAAAAAAIVRASPDAILAPGFRPARAALMATNKIPIVTLSEDMVADGLVSSFARPDSNITGISLISPDLDGKRGDLLTEAVPGLRHVAVLADPSVDKPAHLEALTDSAKAHGNRAFGLFRQNGGGDRACAERREIVGSRGDQRACNTVVFLQSPVGHRTCRELNLPPCTMAGDG